jgi:predicted dehydrogenase
VNTLRAGLSGCSGVGASLLQRLPLHRDATIVVAHDDDAGRAAAFAAEHRLGTAAASFAALLATGIDFVVLAGNLAARREQVAAAAAQGVHCLLLAPFAADLATAVAMASDCAAAQVKLGVLVPEFADPLWDQVRRMIAADWLGGVVAVQGLLGVDEGLRGSAGDVPTCHPFVDLASRHVHLASWLVGRPGLRVTAQSTRAVGVADDGGVATAVLRGNVACTFTCSRASSAEAFAVHGTDGSVRVAGECVLLRGRHEFRGASFDYLVPGQELALSRAELQPGPGAAAASELVGRFARWIEDCDDFPCPAEQALEDLRLVAAMLRAAQSGRTETV